MKKTYAKPAIDKRAVLPAVVATASAPPGPVPNP